MIQAIDKKNILKFLTNHPSWQIDDQGRFILSIMNKDYLYLVSELIRIAELADRLDHHPDITLGWGKLNVFIHTHEIDAITQRDLDFVQAIDFMVD